MPSPIRWDPLLARATAQELDTLLRGSRVRALRLDGEARDLVLLLRERTVLWRLHPRRGYLRILGPLEPEEGDIRIKARIVGVGSVPDDRIIRVAFGRAGAVARMTLVVELLGNQWNALVTEGETEAVRHVLWRRDAARAALVGHAYDPPRSPGRAGVAGDVSREEWIRVLEPLPPQARPAALVRSFAWTSPLNASALLGATELTRNGVSVDPGGDDVHASNLEVGYDRWTHVIASDASTAPVVLETASGLQPYPFPLAGTMHRPAESVLAAIEACAAQSRDVTSEASRAAAKLGPSLMHRLEHEARRAARREERLQAELTALDDPEALRRIGDLILARYHEIPAGASRARLTGFDGEPLEVALDTAEAPHENAARYYARAAKAERGKESLPGLLERARIERKRLQALLGAAHEGTVDTQTVLEVVGSEETPAQTPDVGLTVPYRTFKSSGGLEIRVGRGARFNDDLTFRHSSPGDAWLHARHSAGAHVILRWPGPGSPPARDLEEAATLAALHSKARTSGSVPVDWTLRKYVRKRRGAPRGEVVAERVKTVFVEPDPSLLKALLWTR